MALAAVLKVGVNVLGDAATLSGANYLLNNSKGLSAFFILSLSPAYSGIFQMLQAV